MPEPELFTGTHDSETVRTLLNACEMYSTLSGISNENNKALFSKIYLANTAYIWYNSQSYNQTMGTFAIVKHHMLDYFISSDYIKRERRELVACKMG